MWPNSQEIADLVTFTEEILNGKLHFRCSMHGYIHCSSFNVSWEHKLGQYCINVLLKWMKNYKFIRWLYFWSFLNEVVCLICFSLHRKLCSFLFQNRSECTAQKWSFPLRISSVNVTKSAIFSRIGHIYWRDC